MTIDFFHDHRYKKENSFRRIKFGANKPLLETELNEMQRIQEDSRASMVRNMIPSGFLEIVSSDFNAPYFVFSPDGRQNTIAIGPSKLIVAGYEINIGGKEETGGSQSRYTYIDLVDAPTSYSYDNPTNFDLVFLEAWFEELSIASPIYQHGNVDGKLILNEIGRVDGKEVARRVGLRYKIRVEKNIKFSDRNRVFYDNDVYAKGPLSEVPTDTKKMFKFFGNGNDGDFGVFVAKNEFGKNMERDLHVLNGVVYAVPMFVINRRVFKNYGATNIDYSIYAPKKNNNKLSYRPDGLFCDEIVPSDIFDIRRLVSFSDLNYNQVFDESFKKLVSGELRTKSLEKNTYSSIDLSGLNSSFNNRQHEQEIVQLISFDELEKNKDWFVLNPNNNKQKVLYDIFLFSISSINEEEVDFTFKIPEYINMGLKVKDTATIKIIQRDIDATSSQWVSSTTSSPLSKSSMFAKVKNLSQYRNYEFKIELTNEGENFYSKTISLRTLDKTAPTVPSNLVANSITNNSFVLSWSSATDLIGPSDLDNVKYEVYLDGTIKGETSNISFIVSGLNEYQSYNVFVIAKDIFNNKSNPSSEIIVKTLDLTAPTIPVVTIDPFNISGNSFMVAWQPSTDIHSGLKEYQVKYQKAGGTEQSITVGNSVNNYTINGLDEYGVYEVWITAVDNENPANTVSSSKQQVITKDVTAPNKPTLSASQINGDSVLLTWNRPNDTSSNGLYQGSGVSRYKLYKKVGSTTDIEIIDNSNSSVSKTLSGLSQATEYIFSLEAIDASNNTSVISDEILVKTKSAPTDISLSTTNIMENNTANAVVGTLSVTDIDISDTVTYALVGGTGSDDNASFNIYGNLLRASVVFNYEIKTSYNVRIRATDSYGLFFEEAFIINVTDDTSDNQITLTTPTVSIYTITSGVDAGKIGYSVAGNFSETGFSHIVYSILNLDTGVSYINGGSTTSALLSQTITPSGILNGHRIQITARSIPINYTQYNYSEIASAETTYSYGVVADTQAPTTPVLSSINVGLSSFRATWTASTDNVGVTGYEVYLDSVQVGITNNLYYDFSNLTPNTTYTVTVRAKDAADNKSSFGTLTQSTLADTVSPTQPTGVGVDDVSATSVRLYWNASTDNVGVAGYRVFRDSTLVGTTIDTSMIIAGLSPSTPYLMKVVAFDATGNNSIDGTVFVTTNAKTTPSISISVPTYMKMNSSYNLSATLTANGTPITNATLSFSVSSTQYGTYTNIGTANTSSSGQATLNWSFSAATHKWLRVYYAGSPTYSTKGQLEPIKIVSFNSNQILSPIGVDQNNGNYEWFANSGPTSHQVGTVFSLSDLGIPEAYEIKIHSMEIKVSGAKNYGDDRQAYVAGVIWDVNSNANSSTPTNWTIAKSAYKTLPSAILPNNNSDPAYTIPFVTFDFTDLDVSSATKKYLIGLWRSNNTSTFATAWALDKSALGWELYRDNSAISLGDFNALTTSGNMSSNYSLVFKIKCSYWA